MQLSCKQNKRLSVYSAHYGRTVNGQAMHCALGDPVHEGMCDRALVVPS